MCLRLAERRRAGKYHAHARQVVAADQRTLQEGQNQRRHDRQIRDAVLLCRREKLLEIETWHRDDGGAVREPELQDDHHAINVEQREHRQNPIALLESVERLGSVDLAEVRHHIAVRQHHAFRQSRRPARVREHDDVFGRCDRDRWRVRGRVEQFVKRPHAIGFAAEHVERLDAGGRSSFLRFVQTRRRRDHQPRPAVFQLLGQFGGCTQRISRRDDATDERDRVEDDGIFRNVVAVNREHVSLAKPAAIQRGGNPADHVRELTVGERATCRRIDDRRLVREVFGLPEHERTNGDVRNLDGRTRASDNHEAPYLTQR